ncbi:threonine aldolase family protein [Sutcliffiella deserti]|uniref:threonine aldolase family protein n=1 Tax=Sutcliffiella deserti TaxID=2875501 RepID=UPI001CBAF025|nr:beta-eliminating lyase-related protein [Sutcliffiella deserti]
MREGNCLVEAFNQTRYRISGHSRRNVQVLKEAFQSIEGQLESDMYGGGKVIEEFQEKMASYLGKEATIFFPSGTMAQQVALRIWCDRKGIRKVAYHPLSHLEIHEEEGLKKLHLIEPILLGDKNRVVELEDIVSQAGDVSCVLLELPQREIGGQLPDYNTLVSISEYCREKGIKLHLDGARLYEVLPYYQKSATELCELFDSVYVSLYKGIGGIAGAILAGESDFIKESKVWKRRHGGDLISLYPYIISADYYFDLRINNMERYYQEAMELAGFFNKSYSAFTIPKVPVSNMFHVHFNEAKENVETILMELYQATGIGWTGSVKATSDSSCYFEVSIGDRYREIPQAELKKAFQMLDERMKAIQ